MNKREKLFEKFPPISTEKWMEKITADLKGADFSKRLVWKTREGFDVMPFYRQEDIDKLSHKNTLPGEFPFVRGSRITGNEWLVRQDITVADYAEANAKALDILMKGITSLGFIITNPDTISTENISLLLKDIHCESVELNFVTAGKARELLTVLREVMRAAGTDLTKVHASIAADPLGRLLTNGKLCVSIEEGLDYLAELVKESTTIPGLKCVQAGGTLFSNAGTGVVMELAATLSLANEYMAALTARGITADQAAEKIKFSFGTGSDFFPESAKLRAARMLWAIIVKGYKPKSENSSLMTVHSVTGRWNKTLYDPYVNMLRTQTEAMSAVMGGADSITVEPFDTVFGTPDEFSERIARNQQLLLKEESHLDMVADPGAGSWYIEKLTDLIAREAWKLFVETENEGGFLEAVKRGSIQKKIRASQEARKDDIARRREILLGTNQYPNLNEMHTQRADSEKVFAEAHLAGGHHAEARLAGGHPAESHLAEGHPGEAQPVASDVEQIAPARGAIGYEQLRLATEKSARRPIVFMLPIGNFAMRRARSQFASNFFACAGYEVRDNRGFETAEEGVNAAIAAGADIIVICSSDDDYAIVANDIFTLTAGRAIVVVAGNPPCTDDLKAAGIEYFISIRSNVLETLQMFSKKLGIN